MTPDGLPDISDLERAANEATAADLDVVTVLAELAVISDHGDGWVIADGVHLSQTVRGWYGMLADPRMSTGSALIGGPR